MNATVSFTQQGGDASRTHMNDDVYVTSQGEVDVVLQAQIGFPESSSEHFDARSVISEFSMIQGTFYPIRCDSIISSSDQTDNLLDSVR